MEKCKLSKIKNLLQHICVFFLLYNPPLIRNLNASLLNLNTASFDDDDDDDNDDHYCYHHHFIRSTIIIIIIIIIVVIIITIIIIFLLPKRVFFNRCLAVWYPFCFSEQAVYPFTAIKPSSRSSSLFNYLFILSTFTQSYLFFLVVFFFTFSCRASGEK